MGSKKNDLEIIYNIQWKNKPANGGDKNFIGMYDIPATTLNWEIFKSYLLKNSGAGEDVKVSYITDSNREFPIESQTDFQIALYAFRRKARLGHIVNLKLDRISDQPTHKNLRHSNDVETQFDNNEAVSLSSTCNIENPPEWFITYMSQFKKNLTEELTATISSIVSNIKPQIVSQPSSYHSRKSKPECPKRVRKMPTLIGDSLQETKDLLKSLKQEGKLERKLEKLEHKTKKIKEKKLALRAKSSDSDAGHSSSRSHSYRQCEKEDDILQMDAAPVSTQEAVPHLLGGELFLHQWRVMNSGKFPWTSKTTLNFTWGSKALKPLDPVISVPYLKPGEIGTLTVRLQIPKQPGHYECYWHFHHKERRFGHWLGCQVIVDPFDLKGNKSVLETSFETGIISHSKKLVPGEEFAVDGSVTQYSEIWEEPNVSTPNKYTFNIEQDVEGEEPKKADSIKDDEVPKHVLDTLVRDISAAVDDMTLRGPPDTNCSSDSDNQSIVSLSESDCSKSIPEEFVLIPIPDCFKIDQEPKDGEIPEQKQTTDDKDLATDGLPTALASRIRKKSSEELVSPIAEQNPDNSDDNNNSERTNQNSSVGGSSLKFEDFSSNDGSQKSDLVVISIPNKEEEDNAGYAYLIVDGHRMPIPKKILNTEYLKLAEEGVGSSKSSDLNRASSTTPTFEITLKKEESPEPKPVAFVQQESVPTPIAQPRQEAELSDQKLEPDNCDLMSHCSAAGSCFSEACGGSDKDGRLFIFPQKGAGFEVPPPSYNGFSEYKWMESKDKYTLREDPVPKTTASAPPLNLSTHDRNPFMTGATDHVPNFQQTPPDMRTFPPTTFAVPIETASIPNAQPAVEVPTGGTTAQENVRPQQNTPPIHILPETLVSGAVNVASSAINTARSVINMIVPREQGRWVNGHWVSTNPTTPREANLQALAEMGFWNRDLNATLLARYNDDLPRVVTELVQ